MSGYREHLTETTRGNKVINKCIHNNNDGNNKLFLLTKDLPKVLSDGQEIVVRVACHRRVKHPGKAVLGVQRGCCDRRLRWLLCLCLCLWLLHTDHLRSLLLLGRAGR